MRSKTPLHQVLRSICYILYANSILTIMIETWRQELIICSSTCAKPGVFNKTSRTWNKFYFKFHSVIVRTEWATPWGCCGSLAAGAHAGSRSGSRPLCRPASTSPCNPCPARQTEHITAHAHASQQGWCLGKNMILFKSSVKLLKNIGYVVFALSDQ